ncbi:hypothetical protein ACB098_01G222900 [Castanea mollissima]
MEAFLVLVISKGFEDDSSSSPSPRLPPPDSASLLLLCRRYGEPLKKLISLSQERWHRQISHFTLFSPLIHHTNHFTTTDSVSLCEIESSTNKQQNSLSLSLSLSNLKYFFVNPVFP